MLVRGIYAWTLRNDSHAHGVEKLKTPAIHFNFYSETHPSFQLDCFVSSTPLSVSVMQSEAEESQLQLASSSFRSGITCDILLTHSRKQRIPRRQKYVGTLQTTVLALQLSSIRFQRLDVVASLQFIGKAQPNVNIDRFHDYAMTHCFADQVDNGPQMGLPRSE